MLCKVSAEVSLHTCLSPRQDQKEEDRHQCYRQRVDGNQACEALRPCEWQAKPGYKGESHAEEGAPQCHGLRAIAVRADMGNERGGDNRNNGMGCTFQQSTCQHKDERRQRCLVGRDHGIQDETRQQQLTVAEAGNDDAGRESNGNPQQRRQGNEKSCSWTCIRIKLHQLRKDQAHLGKLRSSTEASRPQGEDQAKRVSILVFHSAMCTAVAGIFKG